MKNWLFVSACLLHLLIAAKALDRGDQGSHLGDQDYVISDCKVVSECRTCSFMEMKGVQECQYKGRIVVKNCPRVNPNNPADQIDNIMYEPCESQFFLFDPVVMFILFIIGMLFLSVNTLAKYRFALEDKLYQKLAIERPKAEEP